MNYSQSLDILEEIKKAKKILTNFHRSPDGDSVGSAMAFTKAMLNMGKGVKVVTLDPFPKEYSFLKNVDLVEKIDYKTFDFSQYDLFVTLDSSVISQITGDSDVEIRGIKLISIDHHSSNSNYGFINLVDKERSSTGEVLFRIFEDWQIEIDKDIATGLLTGIIYDTSSLQNTAADYETSVIFSELMKFGANKDEIIFNMYKNLELVKINALSVILSNLKFDDGFGYVWSAMKYEDFKKYRDAGGVKTLAANLFSSAISESDFGIIMVEDTKDCLNVSLRSRTGLDVSKIATELGGGGHKNASAVRIMLPFAEAVEKVLATARKYARKTDSGN